ncbi:hypothetical protein ES703_86612 [subsurface metagenome]
MSYPRHTQHLFHSNTMAWANNNDSFIFFVSGFERQSCGLARELVSSMRQDEGNNVIYWFNIGFLEKTFDLLAKRFSIGWVPSARK